MASNRCAFDSKEATKKRSLEISVQLQMKPVYWRSCEVRLEIFPKISKWSGFSDGLPTIHCLVDWDNTLISDQKEAIRRGPLVFTSGKEMSSGDVDIEQV